jgi:SAM-dependent methyltransferase
MTRWEGDDYQRRFDELAASGVDVHGEAAFVMRREPRSALDAGCGTGRVAIELARPGRSSGGRPSGGRTSGGRSSGGVEVVVGVDVDASMLATARANGPDVEWHEHDLTTLDLGRVFDVVVLAGNVPLFTPSGTQPALVHSCARHVAADGVLVAGFQLGRGYELDDYDRDCRAAAMILAERYSTWAEDPFRSGDGYAVSVHRNAPA